MIKKSRKKRQKAVSRVGAAKKPKPKSGATTAPQMKNWFSREEMARFLDINVEHFDRSYRKKLPVTAVRIEDGRPLFHSRTLVDVLVEAAVIEERTKNQIAEGQDPLLAGAVEGSPALERYRSARADVAEIEAKERKREVVNAVVLKKMLSGFIASIKTCGEYLGKRFGPEAHDLFDEAITTAGEAAERVWEQLQKEPETANQQ